MSLLVKSVSSCHAAVTSESAGEEAVSMRLPLWTP